VGCKGPCCLQCTGLVEMICCNAQQVRATMSTCLQGLAEQGLLVHNRLAEACTPFLLWHSAQIQTQTLPLPAQPCVTSSRATTITMLQRSRCYNDDNATRRECHTMTTSCVLCIYVHMGRLWRAWVVVGAGVAKPGAVIPGAAGAIWVAHLA
jgi:hypothetical protein